jgi:hypothetical protein
LFLWWPPAAPHLSELDPTGTQQRTITVDNSHQDNSYSDGGASAPANGENLKESENPPPGSPDQARGVKQYFHGQPYAHAVDAQGNADCEVGQRGFPRSLFNKFGQSKRYERVISPSVPRTPGDQGPNFAKIENGQGVGRGPARVPPGETFTDEPETGARIP